MLSEDVCMYVCMHTDAYMADRGPPVDELGLDDGLVCTDCTCSSRRCQMRNPKPDTLNPKTETL